MSEDPFSKLIREAVAEGIAAATAQRDKRLLSLEETANYLDVSITTVRELIASGEIPVVEVCGDTKKTLRCCVMDLNTFIDKKRRFRAA
jgi:excisionase family DNA binding protein